MPPSRLRHHHPNSHGALTLHRSLQVLFDANRQAYIVSDLIEDQITLMLRDAGESVLSLSKAYVRYKGHHDVLVNSTMRARIWRR